MKKINIAVFVSDVGFGHLVREKEIVINLFKVFKNIRVTFFCRNNINILKAKFSFFKKKKYIFYQNNFNNILLFNNKTGVLNKNKTLNFLKSWNKRVKNSLIIYNKKLKKFDIIISDLVPEIFYYAKINNKIAFGICHFTWDWFFSKIFKKEKIDQQISLMNAYNNLASKIYLPPFTPKENLKILRNFKEVNFITDKKKKISISKKVNNNVLIMDNGTGAISDLISSTVPYIKNIEGYFFYIGITYLDKKTKILIENSDNMIMINKNLKTMYSYISKVDYVVARAGFNTITECLIYKKPSLLMGEKNNPEILENMKNMSSKNLCFELKKNNFGKNFLKTLRLFEKKKKKIEINLHKSNFQYNGAMQIATDIKKIFYQKK